MRCMKKQEIPEVKTEAELIREQRRKVAAEYRKRNRARLNAYKREWSKNNPDKVKAARERYYLRKAQELQTKTK